MKDVWSHLYSDPIVSQAFGVQWNNWWTQFFLFVTPAMYSHSIQNHWPVTAKGYLIGNKNAGHCKYRTLMLKINLMTHRKQNESAVIHLISDVILCHDRLSIILQRNTQCYWYISNLCGVNSLCKDNEELRAWADSRLVWKHWMWLMFVGSADDQLPGAHDLQCMSCLNWRMVH